MEFLDALDPEAEDDDLVDEDVAEADGAEDLDEAPAADGTADEAADETGDGIGDETKEAADEAAKASFDPTDAGDFWDVVNRQDWDVCASVQRGMSSRSYEQGWFAPMEDESLDIRRWLLPRLDAT